MTRLDETRAALAEPKKRKTRRPKPKVGDAFAEAVRRAFGS